MKKVIIVQTATGAIASEMEPTTQRAAERIQRGANINLNHDEFHTEIVDVTFCPKCHVNALQHDEVMNALSRDNETYICNSCAWKEAEGDMK